jgi:hypothetical protein
MTHILCLIGWHDWHDGHCTRCHRDITTRTPDIPVPPPPPPKRDLPPLPTFRRDNPCPKCGGQRATMRWCKGLLVVPTMMPIGTTLSLPSVVPCYDGNEHFHRACTDCGYKWMEAMPRKESDDEPAALPEG